MTDWISPKSLLALVRNTAPFLYPLPQPLHSLARLSSPGGAESPRAFLHILAAAETFDWSTLNGDAELEDYFALCLACHQATVATFVPTDVDSKIRGLVWRRTRNRETLRNLARIAFAMRGWTIDGISTRAQRTDGHGPVSGHDGEWLSVMAGGHGRLLQCGELELAETMAQAIEDELRRELAAFHAALEIRGGELDVLRLAMSITHNIGDLDQGISFWEAKTVTANSRSRFGRLAHENVSAFAGRFQAVAELYRKGMASEGHRHYPLRPVKALRKSADLLLPLGPFLDSWGETVITHPALDLAEKAEVIDALVRGCRKVPGQQGYFRALAGMQSAGAREFEAACERVPGATKKELRGADLRRAIAVPRASFESRMKKLVAGVR